jgi:hypothetical protein
MTEEEFIAEALAEMLDALGFEIDEFYELPGNNCIDEYTEFVRGNINIQIITRS